MTDTERKLRQDLANSQYHLEFMSKHYGNEMLRAHNHAIDEAARAISNLPNYMISRDEAVRKILTLKVKT